MCSGSVELVFSDSRKPHAVILAMLYFLQPSSVSIWYFAWKSRAYACDTAFDELLQMFAKSP
jgi:hypothetical protein